MSFHYYYASDGFAITTSFGAGLRLNDRSTAGKRFCEKQSRIRITSPINETFKSMFMDLEFDYEHCFHRWAKATQMSKNGHDSWVCGATN